MTTTGEDNQRDEQLRRTRSVRRGVVAAGTTGALGAAIAIGVTTQASGTTDSGTTGSGTTGSGTTGTTGGSGSTFGTSGDQGFDQSPPTGQLAAPGGGGQLQGRSSGS
jgi:hypothetical protein